MDTAVEEVFPQIAEELGAGPVMFFGHSQGAVLLSGRGDPPPAPTTSLRGLDDQLVTADQAAEWAGCPATITALEVLPMPTNGNLDINSLPVPELDEDGLYGHRRLRHDITALQAG